MTATIEMLKVTNMTWRHGVATLHYDNGSTAVLGHVRDLWPLFEAGLLSPEVASRMKRKRVIAKPAERQRSEASALEGKTILARTPDFDHSGPPPADERCACGARLSVDDRCLLGFQRHGGRWQCVACSKGACPCGDPVRAEGVCAFHGYGYCAAPGNTHRTPALADRRLNVDGVEVAACYVCHTRITKGVCATVGCERPVRSAGLCDPCYKGVCSTVGCSRQAQKRGGTCKAHSPRCSEPGCKNSAGTSQSGRCQTHDNGVCKVDGCTAYAQAREHGYCRFHLANGPDAVQGDPLAPGWTYVLTLWEGDAYRGCAVGAASGPSAAHRLGNYGGLDEFGWRAEVEAVFSRPSFDDARKITDSEVVAAMDCPSIAEVYGLSYPGLKRESFADAPLEMLYAALDVHLNGDVEVYVD